MIEVQSHGFLFQKWVCRIFFDNYDGNYAQEWDVPAEHNTCLRVPQDYRNIAVSIKTAKFGSPIGLGDALRQRQINVPFLMIVGFWSQRTASEKWIEDIGCALFKPHDWNVLWGKLDMPSIQEIDALVKNRRDADYRSVRQQAKQWKKEKADRCGEIVINPKIDSKEQRRVQCSLPFISFWRHIGREARRDSAPELFNVPFENPMTSSSRTFSRGTGQDDQEGH